MKVWWDRKIPIPRGHCLSSLDQLVMPIGDPQEGVFYPTLTLMIDSYNIKLTSSVMNLGLGGFVSSS